MPPPTTYLGLSSPVNSLGDELRDGSAVALRGHRCAAATEERHSGRRYDPGIGLSTQAVLNRVRYREEDPLEVAISSALAKPLSQVEARTIIRDSCGLEPDFVHVVDHHRSHAAEAFASCGVDEALVFVNDSMGDVIPTRDGSVVQCQSIYVAHRHPGQQISLRLYSRDFPDGNGYGQLFRAVTLYLGYPGYHHASKVMAIAGCDARLSEILPSPHSWERQIPEFRIRLDPANPIDSLDLWLKEHLPKSVYRGPRGSEWFRPDAYKTNGIASLREQDLILASWVQQGWQRFLTERVCRTAAEVGIRHICLSGGVSLNCVANALVRDLPEVDEVYVGCAPGDSGQALGNLYLICPAAVNYVEPPYLTRPEPISGVCRSSLEAAAGVLLSGQVVAVGRGSPEYGPRALGHRSLLALPTARNVARLREIKKREDYQPFAVTLTEEYADTHLAGLRSPYMSFAPRIGGQAGRDMKAVIHSDDTCRIQTLSGGQDPWLHELLLTLQRAGHPPILINTSLNLRGETMAADLPSPSELAHKYGVALGVVETGTCPLTACDCVYPGEVRT